MLELKASEFHRVGSLFDGLPYGPSIPNSVIAGIGHGRVFANDPARATAALVYNNGACTLAGAADDLVFAEQVCQWLLEYHGSDYFILYAFPEAWEKVLDSILGSSVKKRRRFDFNFNRSRFARNHWKDVLPARYEIRRIDEHLMQRIRDVANPYSRSYWKSAADFEQHGIGFCALHQDAIVSMCYTAFAWHGHHDIDILRQRWADALTQSPEFEVYIPSTPVREAAIQLLDAVEAEFEIRLPQSFREAAAEWDLGRLELPGFPFASNGDYLARLRRLNAAVPGLEWWGDRDEIETGHQPSTWQIPAVASGVPPSARTRHCRPPRRFPATMP